MRNLFQKVGKALEFFRTLAFYSLMDCKDDNGSFKPRLLRLLKGNRKIVTFYSDCHNVVYADILRHSRAMKEKCIVLGCNDIRSLKNRYPKYVSSQNVWRHADVFIYTPGIPARENIPTIDEILTWLPENVQIIRVTNAAFRGYYPQHTARPVFPYGRFVWGDKNLNRMLQAGKTDETAVLAMERQDYFTSEQVLDNWNLSLKMLRLHERECDIGVADYIEEHGRERILYWSTTHPKNVVLLHACKKMFARLGVIFDVKAPPEAFTDLRHHGEAVYPSTCFALGIDAKQAEEQRIKPGKGAEVFTFGEYLREYIRTGIDAFARDLP